jgi:cell division protein FtsQ
MARTPRFQRAPVEAPPADIRLMNVAARVLALLGVLAIAATVLVWLARQPVFAVHSIRIEGETTRNSVATIRANALPRLTGNFFTIDLQRARRAFESVPWVRHAVVSRVWPNRLLVRLEEHRPVALWEEAGEEDAEKIVNSHGEVFEANLGDVEDDELPVLQGPDGSSAHVLTLLERLSPVLGSIGQRIDTIALSGRGSWRLELDNGAEVQLGRGSDDEVLARTERFAATLGQLTERYQRPLEYADLRHRDAYAVRLKGVTTEAESTNKARKQGNP